jgi:transcription-repair coupling factor (superfamily II helicase)
MLVPRPQPAGFGAQPLRDGELLGWARDVIEQVIDPQPAAAGPTTAHSEEKRS